MSRLAVAVMATGVAATAAYAATPGSGEVSNAAPEVAWSGTVTSGGVQFNAWTEDPSAPCAEGQTCDPFKLKVTDQGDVIVRVTTGAEDDRGNETSNGVRVTKPDGSYAFFSGTSSADAPFEFKIEKAKGDYTLHTVDSFVCCGPLPYNASATLAGAAAPAPAPAPADNQGNQGGGGGSSQPAPSNNPAPPAQPAPAPQPQTQQRSTTPSDFTLTAKAPKVSARKARKSFKVAVTTSRPIQKLTVFLKKGKKTVGGGTVNRFKGKGSVKVNSKGRLKAGSYQLSIVGQDGTVRVARTIKLRIRR